MNFLAHLYLSGSNEKIKVGNFIGDFVKGNQLEIYDSEIQKGIKLHREIDHFTDTHEIVLKSKVRLRESFGHYSPVIVDIFYDHFLAKNWIEFYPIELKKYTADFYTMIANYSSIVPDAVNNMLTYMKAGNWLYNYQFLEGINKALSGMAKRTKFDSKMETATASLEENYEAFQNEFNEFFPLLVSHSKSFLK